MKLLKDLQELKKLEQNMMKKNRKRFQNNQEELKKVNQNLTKKNRKRP